MFKLCLLRKSRNKNIWKLQEEETIWLHDFSRRNYMTAWLQQNVLKIRFGLVWFMVFNAPFNHISVLSCQSELLAEETGVPGKNHWHVTSHKQNLSHNVVSSFKSKWFCMKYIGKYFLHVNVYITTCTYQDLCNKDKFHWILSTQNIRPDVYHPKYQTRPTFVYHPSW